MVLSKAEAYELGNALLDASSSINSSEGRYCICKMDSGELFSFKCKDKDDGHDNGFKTIAMVTM